MISESIVQKIESLAQGVATRVGVQIYDIEFSGGAQGRTLRIFIDKEGGPGIEDCTNVSRGLNEVLDADENFIPGGKYVLEVSTPGLERSLKQVWHFEKVIGKEIWLKLSRSLDSVGVENKKIKNAKQVTELLEAVVQEPSTDGGAARVFLQLSVEGESVKVPLSLVEKAKLVFDFKEGKHDKKSVAPKPNQKKQGKSHKHKKR